MIVASLHHGRLSVFSASGTHQRTFDPKQLVNPSGMCVHDRFLYVVDSRTKKLNVFAVTEV